jgi:hypothetical protein
MTGAMTNANLKSMQPTGLPMSVGVFTGGEKSFWGFTGMMELKS